MPIENIDDAKQLEKHLKRFFEVSDSDHVNVLREMYVEEMDFESAQGTVPLQPTPKNVHLPEYAERIASAKGFNVVYVQLRTEVTKRVRKSEAVQAAKLISSALGEDMVLLMSNSEGTQLHFILPTFETATPMLRRMVIERDLPRRTAVEQLSNCYYKWQKSTLRQALNSAYDVEKVADKFFKKYSEVFNDVEASIVGFGTDDEEQQAKRIYTQTLFNRLMFVYFVSRKKWLRMPSDSVNEYDYLNALHRAYEQNCEAKNFYSDRLRLLFFAGLNSSTSQDLAGIPGDTFLKRNIGEVPFLNGGLFEETLDDKRTEITVPDDAIQRILTELFDKFNFTILESTPFDVEVAVDPEMLGKVFEELVTGRHESGSYYTPRPIVAFMAREALKTYIEGALPELSEDAVNGFVDRRDVSAISINLVPKLQTALSEITVLDPACGSGAYLVGMLHELVDLETALMSDQLLQDAGAVYELKLRIIERNIYGSDISQFAVNIAMLRLWLSLAVDHEDDKPKPLPNLDFKILCGDSLTSPDPSPQYQLQLDGDSSHELREKLGILKHDFMSATGAEKTSLHSQIDELTMELKIALKERATRDNSIEWRTHFAEVFDRRNGFDVVIANPPYRRQEGLASEKAILRRLYPDIFTPTADYHTYFFARSIQLLRPNGSLSFITSNKYMRARYGEKLRQYLPKNLSIKYVIDFGDLPVFSAAAYPAVVIGRKTTPPPEYNLVVADLALPVRRYLASKQLSINRESVATAMGRLPLFIDESAVPNFPQIFLRKHGWILEDPKSITLFDRLMNMGSPMKSASGVTMFRGVTTGLNRAFEIGEATRKTLIQQDPNSSTIIKPWLRGRDIDRWSTEWNGRYLIIARRGINLDSYPAIREHLEQYRHPTLQRGQKIKGLEPRGGSDYRKKGAYKWYELQDATDYFEEFDKPKVIFNRFINKPTFAFDNAGFIHNDACYSIVSPNHSIAAIVNSSVGWWLLSHLCTPLQNGYLQVFIQFLEKLPLPFIDNSVNQRIAHLVKHLARNPSDSDSEAEIEEMIFDEYKMSGAERTLIGEWFAQRPQNDRIRYLEE